MLVKYSFSKAKASIVNLIEVGACPHTIVANLNKLFSNSPNQSQLENTIRTKLSFTWDSTINLWLEDNKFSTSNTSGTQISWFNSSCDINSNVESLRTIYNNAHTMLKENQKLQNKFEHYLAHIEKNISTNDIVKYCNANNKKKTSINLNLDLYAEAERLICEKFDVKKSTTQIINTSLLLVSLYLKEEKSKK